jgi:hypothetical protein
MREPSARPPKPSERVIRGTTKSESKNQCPRLFGDTPQQILRGLDITENCFRVPEGMVVASLITQDGYALTSNHMIKPRAESTLDTVSLTGDDNRP